MCSFQHEYFRVRAGRGDEGGWAEGVCDSAREENTVNQ